MKLLFRSILAITLSLSGISLFAQDAVQWRGAGRDGIYNDTGLQKSWSEGGPELLWHYDDLGLSHSSAAVHNGTVYTCGVDGENGFVIALDFNGKEIWRTIYGKEWFESFEGVRSTPAINDGLLYMMSSFGLISAMDLKTGDIVWKVDLIKDYGAQNIKWGLTENLLIIEDMLIATPGGKDHSVVSLNKKTGEMIWSSKATGDMSAYCSPQVADHKGKKLIFTHTANDVICIDAANGEFMWNFTFPNEWSVHPNTPIYKDGMLFCASGYGQGGVKLKISDDGRSVSKMWENKDIDNQVGGFILVDGKIYGAGMKSRKWMCIDWETGKELYSTKEHKVGTIIAADGLQYWYSQSGKVMLVEAKDDSFKIISEFKVPFGSKQHWAHLVIEDKILYVRHGESLMAYNIAGK